MKKLFSVALISLALASTAFAASSTPPDKTMMEKWTGAIGDVFFTDNTMMTMRSTDEVAANWAKLTDAQKDEIRGDCKKFATSTDVCTWIAGH